MSLFQRALFGLHRLFTEPVAEAEEEIATPSENSRSSSSSSSSSSNNNNENDNVSSILAFQNNPDGHDEDKNTVFVKKQEHTIPDEPYSSDSMVVDTAAATKKSAKNGHHSKSIQTPRKKKKNSTSNTVSSTSTRKERSATTKRPTTPTLQENLLSPSFGDLVWVTQGKTEHPAILMDDYSHRGNHTIRVRWTGNDCIEQVPVSSVYTLGDDRRSVRRLYKARRKEKNRVGRKRKRSKSSTTNTAEAPEIKKPKIPTKSSTTPSPSSPAPLNDGRETDLVSTTKESLTLPSPPSSNDCCEMDLLSCTKESPEVVVPEKPKAKIATKSSTPLSQQSPSFNDSGETNLVSSTTETVEAQEKPKRKVSTKSSTPLSQQPPSRCELDLVSLAIINTIVEQYALANQLQDPRIAMTSGHQEMTYPSSNDILVGLHAIKGHKGNEIYADIIELFRSNQSQSRRMTYRRTLVIASQLYDFIDETLGGRFLYSRNKFANHMSVWIVLPREDATRIIRKSLCNAIGLKDRKMRIKKRRLVQQAPKKTKKDKNKVKTEEENKLEDKRDVTQDTIPSSDSSSTLPRSAKAESKSDSSTAIALLPTNMDVLCSEPPLLDNEHAGNIWFRSQISMLSRAYEASTCGEEKVEIARKIISRVWRRGGRFLVQIKGNDDWNEIDCTEAIIETRKAFLQLRDGSCSEVRFV